MHTFEHVRTKRNMCDVRAREIEARARVRIRTTRIKHEFPSESMCVTCASDACCTNCESRVSRIVVSMRPALCITRDCRGERRGGGITLRRKEPSRATTNAGKAEMADGAVLRRNTCDEIWKLWIRNSAINSASSARLEREEGRGRRVALGSSYANLRLPLAIVARQKLL